MTEILAPAGGKESAYAAIGAGADAIYLGLDKFSARSSAENFDTESFSSICAYAHAFGVKVYVALNTMVKDGELESFLASVRTAWNAGADAVILQDAFLGKFIKEHAPQIVLHLSTQAGTCNKEGARLAKRYGFDRVILARETALEDVAEISEIIETEVFIQGALCTCFSGQCYMSSFIGGNSGNRGKCKQPCRKLYSFDRKGLEEKAYRLSLSDLSVGEEIKKLVAAGVTSFKIEGRMRRPEYVAAAVGYYKAILGGAPSDGAFRDLKRTYNRGNYTKGLAFGQDKSFISSAVQGHIGEFVGTVRVENSKYVCQSRFSFRSGDGFKILRGGKEVGGGTFGGEVRGGFIVNSRERLKNGDKVFVTTDGAVNERLLSVRRSLALQIEADLFADRPAVVAINGERFVGDAPLERANTRPLTEEDIRRCFLKKDDYPYEITFGAIRTDGVFLAASALNALRRKVFGEYFQKISKNNNIPFDGVFPLPQTERAENKKTAVLCTDLRGVTADIGILKPDSADADVSALTEGFRGEKYLYVPPFLTGKETEKICAVAALFDGIYCDSYFGIELAQKLDKPLFAGTGMNIANRIAFAQCGARYVSLSKELTLAEAEPLCSRRTFYLTAGNLKVMDLIYCPFEKKCQSCDRRKIYTMTDGEGRAFPVRRYRWGECRFEVYNCVNLVACGVKTGRLYDLSLEENAAQVFKNAGDSAALEKIFKNFTRGHSVCGIY